MSENSFRLKGSSLRLLNELKNNIQLSREKYIEYLKANNYIHDKKALKLEANLKHDIFLYECDYYDKYKIYPCNL